MWRLLADLDTNPDFFPDLIERVSEGEPLDKTAATIGVHYSVLRNWIRGNNDREAAFVEAALRGKTRRVERVLEATFATAVADITEPVKHADRLRAAEILLKPSTSVSVSSDKPSSGITISFVEAKDGKPTE